MFFFYFTAAANLKNKNKKIMKVSATNRIIGQSEGWLEV